LCCGCALCLRVCPAVLAVHSLFPSVPLDTKQCVQDCVLPNGMKMDKGKYLGYVIYGVCRDKGLYGEDACEFKPERWIGSRRRNAFEYPVFNVRLFVSACIVGCAG
jgi:hypothetical protein